MLLLDTDVLIDVLRNHLPALEWFAGLPEPPSIPGFVAMELVQAADNKQRIDRAMKLIEPLPILWPSEEDCGRALANFRRLHLSHGLGLLDALIAATATGSSATLLTFNLKHYRALDDLHLEAPYER